MICLIYADRQSHYRFVLPNVYILSIGLGKPNCIGIGLGLGLGLEVVFRSIHNVNDITIDAMIL